MGNNAYNFTKPKPSSHMNVDAFIASITIHNRIHWTNKWMFNDVVHIISTNAQSQSDTCSELLRSAAGVIKLVYNCKTLVTNAG